MKRSKHALRINRLLGNSGVSRLMSCARALGRLDARLHELIPPPLNEHCRILSLRDDTLVLAADSPVWAARLRFHSTQLIRQLAESRTVKLRTVCVRIRPSGNRRTTQMPRRRNTLSGNTSRLIEQAARDLSDPDLKAALLRLASRRDPAGQS
jgi:hypothetical protein